ncbi:hypothetical protein [Rodentibacter trehalosifermentans]|uniref:Uncharacterized protein n=1 Tax=Rodentibacter trehalosifermentans TaxID=1908263 RepID=A0A1V3IXI9_9PAST|nr:hypothetical protein [Rodentibacter trehalosifermentans]OOF47072.1 hypothetical protein BKK51_00745 [Rodentibacter trehalosifermentans]OOF51453.1 hypothetical protein BKK52_00070 [Rodentibacter trehalosifermentans]OOF53007.1 hypothetical protein BKK53_02645 [Rodentibacter trehalosifermentans]
MANRQKAISYFENFAISLENIEQKIRLLLTLDMESELYQYQHRKFIKMLTRASTNLRLFQESLKQNHNIPDEYCQCITSFTHQFTRLFLMTKHLPDNALVQFNRLAFSPLKETVTHIIDLS